MGTTETEVTLVLGDILASVVNASGKKWENARKAYLAATWFRPRHKLELRSRMRRLEAAFYAAIDIYDAWLFRRYLDT